MPQDIGYNLAVGELSQHTAEKLAELMDEAELVAEADEPEGDAAPEPGPPAPPK